MDTPPRQTVYEAVRWSWKVDPERAAEVDYVLATYHGTVIGVFVADEWLPATVANFPALATDPIGPRSGRFGFVGREAPAGIMARYLGRRMEERRRGAQNPIRYLKTIILRSMPEESQQICNKRAET